MTIRQQIEQFLAASSFAVVGASTDPSKYGHRVYACYLCHGYRVYPINPNAERVLGHPAYPNIASLPERVEAVSVITPPAVTKHLMSDLIAAGVAHVWLQPGAEHPEAIAEAVSGGITVIYGGPCLLVELGC